VAKFRSEYVISHIILKCLIILSIVCFRGPCLWKTIGKHFPPCRSSRVGHCFPPTSALEGSLAVVPRALVLVSPPPPGALEVSLASRAVAPSTDWPWFLVLVLSSRPQPRRPRGFLGLGSRGSWPPAPRGALEDSCGIGSLCVGHRPSPLAPSRVPWPWFLPCWSWFPAHWRHRGFLGPLSWVLLACRSWCPLFGSRRVGFPPLSFV
jgi:hypothetical protein